MEIGARRAYLAAVKKRYKNSSKKQKTQILQEFCQVCNYSRKHAIKLLSWKQIPRHYQKRVGAPRKYPEKVSSRLAEIWKIMGNPCSATLKQALPLWLPYDLDSDEETTKLLLQMGTSTIERHLNPWKKKQMKGKSTT
jgi:hypothetical protein